MAKSKRNPRVTTKPTPQPPNIVFPHLAPKTDLECKVLLEDQILLIDNLLSVEECKAFVKFIDTLPLELTPPKKRGEAERVNHRISIPSPTFASALFPILAPHLPSFSPPTSARTKQGSSATPDHTRVPHSLNSNIRLYKYTSQQHFGPHYDDSVSYTTTDPQGAGRSVSVRSEWTVLVYLTGIEDGVKGGETLFYLDGRSGKGRDVILAPLTRGTALLHRHGNECLLHEGSRVEAGEKYVLRSDIMFIS